MRCEMPCAAMIWKRLPSSLASSNSYRLLLEAICLGVAVPVRGRTRQYVAPSAHDMINPMPILGTTLYLEAN